MTTTTQTTPTTATNPKKTKKQPHAISTSRLKSPLASTNSPTTTNGRSVHTALRSTRKSVLLPQRRKMSSSTPQNHPDINMDDPQIRDFYDKNPHLLDLVNNVSNHGSKLTKDPKHDVRQGERMYIDKMPEAFQSLVNLQQLQANDEQLDEEALIDSLLYDKASTDPHERQLRLQHSQLKQKQQFLKQKRVMNMNEFIKPPQHNHLHAFEQQFNSITANQAGLLEDVETHKQQMEEFESSIQAQRQQMQEQLNEAIKEEKRQTRAQKRHAKKLANEELDEDVDFEQQRDRLRRAGPGQDGDFMSHHGLFDGVKGKKVKKNKPFGLGGDDDDIDDDDDDDNELDSDEFDEDDIMNQIPAEFEEDINSVLSRQYIEDPTRLPQGISYEDIDDESDLDTTASEGEQGHEQQQKHSNKNKPKAKMNKHGQIIQEDDNVDDDDDDDDHNENNHNDPVKDFEFPDRVDAGVKKQNIRIPTQWRKHARPILNLLKQTLENPKVFSQRVSLLEGLDTAAKMLLELSARTDLPDIPRQIFAHIINLTLPKVRMINGVPQSAARPITPAVAPFLLLVMTTARQNRVQFSDVEWQWVLSSIAQTANPVNCDDVQGILTNAIDLFRKSQIIRGVKVKRAHSNALKVDKKSPKFTRYALISAPNVRLIEQRAWLEFYTLSHNRDVLLPFTRIHDSVVFKPANFESPLTNMGFIAEHIGDDIMTRPSGIDFHRVDDAYETFDNHNNPQAGGEFFDAVFDSLDGGQIPTPKQPKQAFRTHKFAHYKDHTHNNMAPPVSVRGNPINLDEELTEIRAEKLTKNWLSPDHHPELYNYPEDDGVQHLAYMAAPDDILTEPWLYQPPHFRGLLMGRGSSGFKFRTARAGSRYLPTLNTT